MFRKNNIFILVYFLLFFISCNGQEKSKESKLNRQKAYQEQVFICNNILPARMDTVTNFQLFDASPPFPFYSFYNKTIEAYITISYKGKTKEELNYWDIYNLKGYFSEYKDVDEPYIVSKEIKKHLLERGIDKYNVTASIVYKKDIKNYYSENDVEYEPNANRYRYIFQNNRWEFDKSLKISENKEN